MNKNVFNSQKNQLCIRFENLANDCREVLKEISKDKKIEVKESGIDFSMRSTNYESDEVSDVFSIQDGIILFCNGNEINVDECTNVTDMVGLIDVIEL
jgi:hypothetical protein